VRRTMGYHSNNWASSCFFRVRYTLSYKPYHMAWFIVDVVKHHPIIPEGAAAAADQLLQHACWLHLVVTDTIDWPWFVVFFADIDRSNVPTVVYMRLIGVTAAAVHAFVVWLT